MNSADLLCNSDRCPRLAYWSRQWEANKLRPIEILRRSVEEALTSDSDDPGQDAGDSVMTYFADRGVETKENDLYGLGMHTAALADIITTVLRESGEPWGRPEDLDIGLSSPWTSGTFLEPSGVRLRRVCIVSSLSIERLESEKHSWRTIEAWIYGMPLTLTFIVIGQERSGRHSAPWSKGYVHPVGNQNLRFKKRDGGSLTGAGWIPKFREDADLISRDHWIECMRKDDVFNDVCWSVDIPVPIPQITVKVKNLAKLKLERLRSLEVAPEPNPSVCDHPSPCQFRTVCWQFRTEPSQRDGFVELT